MSRGSDITDYVGNKIYENGSLKRILVDGGYVEGGVYHFYIQDHQGNNRVVATGTETVVQKNHYYPFGMTFGEVAATEQDKQPFKYNGKELDRKNGLNLYDYSARYMEPALGRFTTMDPHAENYYAWSPYHYAGNSPVNITDPTGMDWYVNDEGQYFWKEGSQDIDGYKNVGNYISIQTGKNAYINFYQNAGISANKAVNAFDLISQSGKLQNELLGKNSVLSSESQSALFNGLVSQSVDAVARPIGEAITEYGAGAIGGAALGKAVSWGIGKVASKVASKVAKETGKELFNFSIKAAEHMSEPGRAVPLQILDLAIKNSKGIADPRGSKALMHTIEMWKNGKPYNLEVLYNKTTNSIWHFKYSQIKP